MAWTYTVLSVTDNPVPDGNKYATVRFTDGTLVFTRTYKLAPGNFGSAQDVTNFLAARVNEMNAVGAAADALQGIVNQDFTADATPIVSNNTITMFQFRAALAQQGQLVAAGNAITALGGLYPLAWQFCPVVPINGQLATTLAQQLGLDLVALFAVARVIGQAWRS